MGVKGLATFLKENRQSICSTIQLPTRSADNDDEPRTVLVVDAWSIIYQLYLESLPWASGGEYLRFYRIIRRLIDAWRKVGLEPVFVYDGSAPIEKHKTLISRLSQTTKAALFFHTTSVISRSSPSFSRNSGKSILPPFVAECFTHALQSVGVETYHHPVGEADGICVSIAHQRGGYILSLDSDYLILISGPGATGVKGYCPLDMMSWIEGAVQEEDDEWEQQAPKKGSAEWYHASSRTRTRPSSSQRQSAFVPSHTLTSPILVLTAISPAALRTRLRLPANVMPLFASLVGNDYTPPSYTDLFYEPGLSSVQKIEKAARMLREVVFAPNAAKQPSSKASTNAGDQAVLMVKKVVIKLATRVHLTDSVINEMVDTIIESTFQYVLPGLPDDQSPMYPFDQEAINDNPDVLQAKERYAELQRRGKGGHITHAYIYPGRVYLWPIMEDPSGPSLRAGEGVRKVRAEAWRLLEEGCGGLCWPEPTEEEVKLAQEDEELAKLLADAELKDGKEESETDEKEEANSGTSENGENKEISEDTEDPADDDDPHSNELPSGPKERPRVMVEWVRQGSSSKHTGVSVPLAPLPDQPSFPSPTSLAPISTRLTHYLRTLSSDTPAIQSLPPHLHPLLAGMRLAIIESASRSVRNDTKWRRAEVEAVLRAGLGMYSAWEKESRIWRPKKDSDEGAWPQLGGRQVGLVAGLGAVMLDALVLAQVLLLLPEEEYGPQGDGPECERNGHTNGDAGGGGKGESKTNVKTEETTSRSPLTHLTPFMFISGVALHNLLSAQEPPSGTGWRWSGAEEEMFARCLPAVGEGLEDCIVGWGGGALPPGSAAVGVGSGMAIGGEAGRKKEKEKKKVTLERGSNGAAGSRFDLLMSL